ncbi:DKNYY domain-containing protein [Fulvivirga maritima]|uniref:DKNYY domain-containing protein n=1 Tax=Fulvivirga maritima TaxID=2904247 RepID=UPI001F4062AA|nr:DKNYY domain-containing protein [Fulvivirga maritima]UII26324.1 DKNYY domain-containing protein [Fulvivirga maritima]
MIISIIVTIFLVFYGGIFMMSPMMIASHGFSDSLSSIITALFFLGYPVIIFLLMTIFNIPFYGMAPSKWLIGFSVPFILAVMFYRIPQMIININKGIPNSGYHIGKDAVYLNGKKIKSADPASFDPMEDVTYYSKDAKHVFYYGKVIPSSDPATFTPVPTENEKGYGGYWKDKNNVYIDGKILKGADPASMACLRSLYAKDAKHIYYSGRLVEGADPQTFHFVSDGIAIDEQFIYVYGRKSNIQTDTKNFEVVGDESSPSFCRDKNNVYLIIFHNGDPLLEVEGADPTTFEKMERGYYKDSHQVYYHDSSTRSVKVLEEADPANFSTGYDHITRTEARDKNHAYMSGKLVSPKE